MTNNAELIEIDLLPKDIKSDVIAAVMLNV